MSIRLHSTGIVLGDTYEDEVHGKVGIATIVSEFLHGCARVTLEYVNGDEDICEATFDIGQLKHQRTGRVMSARRVVEDSDAAVSG